MAKGIILWIGLIILLVGISLIFFVFFYKTPVNVDITRYNQTTNETYTTSSVDDLPLWIILFSSSNGGYYSSSTNTYYENDIGNSQSTVSEDTQTTTDESSSDSVTSDSADSAASDSADVGGDAGGDAGGGGGDGGGE